jgi:hypothetical protein
VAGGEVRSPTEYTFRVSSTSVYNLSPYRYTKPTPKVLSGKSIIKMPDGSSLILEEAFGTFTTIDRSI